MDWYLGFRVTAGVWASILAIIGIVLPIAAAESSADNKTFGESLVIAAICATISPLLFVFAFHD